MNIPLSFGIKHILWTMVTNSVKILFKRKKNQWWTLDYLISYLELCYKLGKLIKKKK